jgi:AraC-like DNA-binding protein
MPIDAGTKGILYPKTISEQFEFVRCAPSGDLAPWIDWYWIIRWNLSAEPPQVRETIPYPSVNLVLEKDRSGIFGIPRKRFSRVLSGAGIVFGFKFRPGAFYPFLKSPVSTLTDSSRSIREVFGIDDAELERTVLGCDTDEEMTVAAESFLRTHIPPGDGNVAVVNQIVDFISAHREITRVEQLSLQFDLNVRALQRLFSRYVGVSPKWVIGRYRLQEAAEELANGAAVSWNRLALELGYFDQAHFIKDFGSLIGMSPAEYAKRATRGDRP